MVSVSGKYKGSRKWFQKRGKTGGRHRTGVALLAVVGLIFMSLGFVSVPAQATPGGGGSDVCGPLDSGKIDTTGDPQTVTVTAPDGKLIDGYCVKAGSSNQGDGPVYVTVDPPVKTLTFGYPGGKAVSHYSLSYTTEPTPEGNLNVSSTCESITFSASGVKPEDAEVVFKLDGVVKAPGTYSVTPGSHTVDLYVNGEKVDSETVTVEECPLPPECPDGNQDEDETKPCYVEREPDVRVESGTREGCKLGGVETTTAVYTTTYSFNEATQSWESSETATSSSAFTPYTAAELKEKGCTNINPPDDTDNPTFDTGLSGQSPEEGKYRVSFGLVGLLFMGLAAGMMLIGSPVLARVRRR